ncbi:cytochrome P450 [Colletotrichum somersetense]|nr:cytochrome P450 [Colletotrichum somersetense]
MNIPNHPGEIMPKVVQNHLTKRLDTITAPLLHETDFAIEKTFGSNSDWSEVKIYDSITDIIARLSSRIFLGPELCRDHDWLNISKQFTISMLTNMMILRPFPVWLRPLVYWLSPICFKFRALYWKASQLVDSIVTERRRIQKECVAAGRQPPVYNDALEWVDKESAGMPVVVADFQLSMSVSAVHTTSDLFSQTMLQLAAHPKVVDALRKEMLEVLPVHGFKKSGFASLKLLDSAIKEAQRIKPLMSANMQRLVLKDTVLEGGVLLLKGEVVAVDAGSKLWDPEKYPDPEKFDP